MNLNGKHYLITGASRGLGKAVALKCAEAGCKALTLWSRNMELLEELSKNEAFENIDVFCQAIDVSDSEALVEAFKEAETNGPFDGLVNCAGYGKPCPFEKVTPEIFAKTMDTNFKAVFFLSQLMFKHLKTDKREGCVINVGSVSGKTPDRTLSVYSPSKAAVIALTQVMSKELAPYKIRVNCVCPGAMDTDMFHKDTIGAFSEMFSVSEEQLLRSTINAIPLKRLVKPEEAAELIVYLLSDKASAITGQSINIDCGLEFH